MNFTETVLWYVKCAYSEQNDINTEHFFFFAPLKTTKKEKNKEIKKRPTPRVVRDSFEIENITRWREDMNFMFDWQEQYFTSERSEQVRYCFCHENIKLISSSQRVMFFLLYGETNLTKAKGGNRDVIERYDTHKSDIRKISHSVNGIYEWFSSQ